MNLAKRFQLLNVALVAAFSVSGLVAANRVEDRPEFKKADQEVGVFRAVAGAKYSGMIKMNPAENKLTVILCGTQTKSGKIKLAKKAHELKNLVAIRNTEGFADSCTQIDKKYAGFREAYGAIALTKLLMLAGLYPAEGYKGTVLVDEYVQGLPMKFVLSNMEQFAALKTYLTTNFEKLGVVPAAQKPLLLLEILDKNAVFTDADNAFLNTYYEVLDPYNPTVKTFFEGAQKIQNDMQDKIKDAKNVAESFGEATMRELEKAASGLETKKLATVLAMLVAVGVGGSLTAKGSDFGKKIGKALESFFVTVEKAPQVVEAVTEVAKAAKEVEWHYNKTNIAITVVSVAALIYVMHVLFSVPEDDEEEAVLGTDVAPEQTPVQGAVAA